MGKSQRKKAAEAQASGAAGGAETSRPSWIFAPSPWLAAGVSVLAGCLLFLSCATFDIWPLAWFGLAPTLWVVMTAPSHKRGFLYGFLTGLTANVGGFYWIVGLLRRFAFLPLVAALPVFMLLCAYQALLFGAFGWFVRVARRRTGLPFMLVAPVVMVALEFVVPFIFPWYLAITQAWVLPVIQLAELTGPLGITFCLVMVSGVIYDVVLARVEHRPWPLRPLIATAATLALVLAWGYLRIAQIDARWEAAPKVKIGVVQPNIRFDLKPQVDQAGRFDIKRAAALRDANNKKHQEASARLEAMGAQLIVWPESSYPYVLPHGAMPIPNPDPDLRTSFHTPLLFGAITKSEHGEFPYNSALMLDKDGMLTGRYDKIFLLMFGEYIPGLKTFPFIRKFLPPTAGMFERGDDVTTFDLPDPRAPGGAWKLGPLICYEDILPRFGSNVGRLHPHVFVNITNDAWFGATSEPWEHLALAVYRTVEHRTGMVRAVQTGVSTFVDATGRVRKYIRAIDPPKDVTTPADVLIDDVAMLEAGHTFYATIGSLWGLGDLLGFLALGALGWVLVPAAREAYRERKRGRDGRGEARGPGRKRPR